MIYVWINLLQRIRRSRHPCVYQCNLSNELFHLFIVDVYRHHIFLLTQWVACPARYTGEMVLAEFLEGRRVNGKNDYYTSEVNFGADVVLFHYYVQTFPFNLLMPNCVQDNDYQQVLGSWDVECLAGNKWSRNALMASLRKKLTIVWLLSGVSWTPEKLHNYFSQKCYCFVPPEYFRGVSVIGGFQSWKSVSIYSFIPKMAKTKIHENTRFPFSKYGETNKLVGESTAEKAP